MSSFIWTHSQKDHPPFTILSFYDISMSCNRNRVQQRHVSVTNNRISRADFVISLNCTAAGHLYTVIYESTTLCNKEIIPSVLLINMRSLNPFTACFYTIPDNVTRSLELEGFRIKLVQIDTMMSFIKAVRTDVVAYIPQRTVIIKEKTGVDAVCTFYNNRITPRAGRIFCCNNIIVTVCFTSCRYESVNDVISSVMITDTWCP